MNQDQRKYLINEVNNTCRSQSKELEDSKPPRPSLNNYLVAAFLDNSIQFQDMKTLQKKIRERVINFGTDDVLVRESDEDDYGYRHRRRRDSDNLVNQVQLIAEELFVVPEAYTKALNEWQKTVDDIEAKIRTLEATRKTIEMKLQIGSPATLERLVTQADNLGDLNLMNAQLILGQDSESQKRLKQ